MQIDILLITDTIDNQLLIGYYDLLGVSARFAEFNPVTSQMIISSRHAIPLPVPINLPFMINFLNLLHPELDHPHPPLFVEEFLNRINEVKPRFICLPHTMRGCQMAAILGANLKTAPISGVDSISQKDDQFILRRNLMNGKWVANMHPKSSPCIFTVSQGAFSNLKHDCMAVDETHVTHKAITISLDSYTSLETSFSETADYPVEEADFVVAAGRGINKEDNLKLIHNAASIFKNAAIGASRPLCDSGWLSYSQQIGETGKHIAPKLYMACGISGAAQHISGLKQAQTIVAVNTDPQAAIFRIANYAIIEKLEDFLPVLVERADMLKSG